MSEKIEVKVSEGTKTLQILEGDALPQREPLKLKIDGNIDSPFRFLAKRIDEINQLASHIIVNRERMSISLKIDETNHFSGVINGFLEFHPNFKKWNINSGTQWTNKELSEFIKKNRTAFASKETAMSLASELQNLRVKVDKELEKQDNNRGDYKAMLAQKVISASIPESFVINVPIFKGQDSSSITVELYIDPSTFSIQLVSYDASDIIETTRDSAINEELTGIREIADDIVIIEQ